MSGEELKLLPCPFCGTDMELVHDHTTEDVDQIIHKTAQPYCPIDGSSAFGVGNENLVAAWNRRHPLPEQPQEGVTLNDADLRSIRKLAGRCADLAKATPVAGEPDPHWWERQSALGDAATWFNVVLAALNSPMSELQRMGQEFEAGWRTIDSAPKDGESVLIWKPDERMVGEYLMAAYWDYDHPAGEAGWVPVGGVHKQGYTSSVTGTEQGYPTHWRPLPAAPSSESKL